MNEEQVIDRILIANDFCHIAHHANNIGQRVLDGLRRMFNNDILCRR